MTRELVLESKEVPTWSTPPPIEPPPTPSTLPSSEIEGLIDKVGTCPLTNGVSFSRARSSSSASEVQIQSFSIKPMTLDPPSFEIRHSQLFPAVATMAAGEFAKRFHPSRFRKSTPI